ncbi:MAG TPA: UPF0280 family protein [Dehalococcoidales bacterium]|nr:UPF0280 family protein [Dehalococcoidales bacterium]
MKQPGFVPRFYRHWSKDTDLVSFTVVEKETDLLIRAHSNLHKKALEIVLKQRALLEGYITRHPGFVTALEPYAVGTDAPLIAREMAEAAAEVGVGPMAAVAGAFAGFVGKELTRFSPEVIVENGGDIFMVLTKQRLIGIFAGNSPLSGKIALRIQPADTPLGVCTSSGTVGHSLSFGKADAAIVLSPSPSLSDAAATAVGNLVQSENDLEKAINFVKEVEGITGIAVIKGEKMAAWGKIDLVRQETE